MDLADYSHRNFSIPNHIPQENRIILFNKNIE